MKTYGIWWGAARTSALVLALGTAAHASGDGFFLWQRSLDWVPGTVQGGTANNPGPGQGGSTIWSYEYTQGGRLGAPDAWYTQPTTAMKWNESWYNTGWRVWSKDGAANPPILPERLIHNVHASTVADIPLVRWMSPLNIATDLSISGDLVVNWNGMNGVGRPVDVDVVIARQDAQRSATTVLFSTTVAKPNPFESVGDLITIPVNLPQISLNVGDSIIISHRGRHGMEPLGAWVNLYDNLTFSAIPAPGGLGLLVAGGLVMARRRRR
jgi:hypothetical protein